MNRKNIGHFMAFLIIIGLMVFASKLAQDKLMGSINILGIYFSEHPLAGVLIFFSISLVAVLLSPFSSLPLVPSAVLAWGSMATAALLIFAWLFGGVFAYWLGSYSRERIIRRFISLRKVEYYKKSISAGTQFWLVLLFRLAIPSELAGYTLGVVRYEFWRYLLATFIVELLVALAAVFSSGFLLGGQFGMFLLIVAAVALVFFFFYYIFQRRIAKEE